MGITEKAAYLKGLFDGYEISENSKESKIIGEMLNLICDMADKISALEADNRELHEYVEELDHDLGEMEELHFEDDYSDLNDDDEDYEEDETEYFELECPSCGEIICFDESLGLDEATCPACGELITDIEICDGNCDCCNDEDCKSQQ